MFTDNLTATGMSLESIDKITNADRLLQIFVLPHRIIQKLFKLRWVELLNSLDQRTLEEERRLTGSGKTGGKRVASRKRRKALVHSYTVTVLID